MTGVPAGSRQSMELACWNATTEKPSEANLVRLLDLYSATGAALFGHGGALSVEGVPSLRSVSATSLVSRHWSEFGTSRACRFCNVQAGAQAIFGAQKCLQRASKRP